MLRAGATRNGSSDAGNGNPSEPQAEGAPIGRTMRHAPMSINQRNKLIEMYGERFGGSETEIEQGLDAIFESAFKHAMAEATLAEASKIISQMIAQKNGSSAAKR